MTYVYVRTFVKIYYNIAKLDLIFLNISHNVLSFLKREWKCGFKYTVKGYGKDFLKLMCSLCFKYKYKRLKNIIIILCFKNL